MRNTYTQASAIRMHEAIARWIELSGPCDHHSDDSISPSKCPDIQDRGGMCHWCQLRASVIGLPSIGKMKSVTR